MGGKIKKYIYLQNAYLEDCPFSEWQFVIGRGIEVMLGHGLHFSAKSLIYFSRETDSLVYNIIYTKWGKPEIKQNKQLFTLDNEQYFCGGCLEKKYTSIL